MMVCGFIHPWNFSTFRRRFVLRSFFPPNLIKTTTKKKKASVQVSDSWQIHIIQLEGLQRF